MVESLGFASGRLKGTGNTYFAPQRMILKIPFYLFPENKHNPVAQLLCVSILALAGCVYVCW